MVYRTARRVVIFIIGFTVLLLGVVMLVAPGPAFVVIPAGLAILATEFAWAAWLLKRIKRQATVMYGAIRGQPAAGSSCDGTAHEKGPLREEGAL